MKSTLCYIQNNKGYFMPLVLLVVALVFITFSMSIKLYQDEVIMTDHFMKRLEAENLFQMTVEKVSANENVEREVVYDYPNGSVHVTASDKESYIAYEYKIRLGEEALYVMSSVEMKED
ncbi:MAG TPA: hypothetical protein VK125_06135 [Bacillota bacterium]|nr:hypothetical protein [Bacillota bacterium]